jgi:hypothetical protein
MVKQHLIITVVSILIYWIFLVFGVQLAGVFMLMEKIVRVDDCMKNPSGRCECQDGDDSYDWDATDNMGKLVSAGVYPYQITAVEYVQTMKMVLLN